MSFTQLVYYSAARRELDAEALKRILESAVRHNLENDITGMLLYSDGSFMQVLEGPAEAIDETMRRIHLDDRHQDVFVIRRHTIDEREFGQWSMGFRNISLADQTLLPHFTPYFSRGFDVRKIAEKPGIAVELLREFGKLN